MLHSFKRNVSVKTREDQVCKHPILSTCAIGTWLQAVGVGASEVSAPQASSVLTFERQLTHIAKTGSSGFFAILGPYIQLANDPDPDQEPYPYSVVEGQRFNDNGGAVGTKTTFALSQSNTCGEPYPLQNPGPTITLSNGNIATLWFQYGTDDTQYCINSGIYLKTSTSSGSRIFSGPFNINKLWYTAISLKDQFMVILNDGVMIAHSENPVFYVNDTPKLRAKVFSNGGVPVSNTFQIGSDLDQRYHSASGLKHGGFVAAWWEYDTKTNKKIRIKAKRYLPGNIPDKNYDLPSSINGVPVHTIIVGSLSNGGFVILLRGEHYRGLFRLLYDANGDKVGNPLVVSNKSGDSGCFPAFLGLSDGGYIIISSGDTSNYKGFGVYYPSNEATTGISFSTTPDLPGGPYRYPIMFQQTPNSFFIFSQGEGNGALRGQTVGVKFILPSSSTNPTLPVGQAYALTHNPNSYLLVPETADQVNPEIYFLQRVNTAGNPDAAGTSIKFTKISLAENQVGLCQQINSNEKLFNNFDFTNGVGGLTVSQPNPPVTGPYYQALISLHVYREQNNLPPTNEPMWTTSARHLSQGWIRVFDSTTKSEGYFGSLYLNVVSGEIIISHRGTEFASFDIPDLFNDLQLAFGHTPLEYPTGAQPFTQRVMNFFNSCGAVLGNLANYYVLHTGHSLGAILAELSATAHNRPAVVFDSPGSENILTDYQKDNAHRITTYQTAPHCINTVNRHAGNVIRLYPLFTQAGTGLVKRSLNILNYLTDYRDYSFQQHKMHQIYKLFNLITGQPYIQSAIQSASSWPSLLGGLAHFISYGCNPYFHEWAFVLQSTSPLQQQVIRENSLFFCTASLLNPTIQGSQQGQTFIGATQGNTIMNGGNGNDQYYVFGGHARITDTGGKNTVTIQEDGFGVTVINTQGQVSIRMRINSDMITQWHSLQGEARAVPNQPNYYVLLLRSEARLYFLYHNINADSLIIVPSNFWQGINAQQDRYILLENISLILADLDIILPLTVSSKPLVLSDTAQTRQISVTKSNSNIASFNQKNIINVISTGGNYFLLGSGGNRIQYTEASKQKSTGIPDIIAQFSHKDQIIVASIYPALISSSQNINGSAVNIGFNRSIQILNMNYSGQIQWLYNQTSNSTIIKRTNHPPTWIQNQLSLGNGDIRQITPDEIAIYDPDSDAHHIEFHAHSVQGGQFINLNVWVVIEKFSYQHLVEGKIAFQHDGNNTMPSYWLQVSDENTILPKNFAQIIFSSDPYLLVKRPTISIQAGTSITVTHDVLPVFVNHLNRSQTSYTITNIEHGRLTYLGIDFSNLLPARFSYDDINLERLLFLQNDDDSTSRLTVTVQNHHYLQVNQIIEFKISRPPSNQESNDDMLLSKRDIIITATMASALVGAGLFATKKYFRSNIGNDERRGVSIEMTR